MRVFLFPLGFHEDPSIRVLVEFKTFSDDKILVFTCKPLSPGSRRAFESLKAFSTSQRFPEPVLVLVNCSDFYDSFKVVIQAVKPFDALFIVEIGMGPRIISHILVQALLYAGKSFILHYEPETGVDSPVIIEQGFLEVISKGLSTSEKNLLRAVPQDGATVYELTKALGVSEKTTRNLVSRLKAKGLLTKVGKGERIFLTKAGWALA